MESFNPRAFCGYVTQIIACILVIWPNVLWAASYKTSWDKSEWTVEKTNLSCALTHVISGFGEAILSRQAGGSDQLVIKGRAKSFEPSQYSLVTRSPSWRFDVAEKVIGDVNVKDSVRLSGSLISDVITQLTQNLYVDINRVQLDESAVSPRYFSVSLTPRNFKEGYANYQDCLSKMIPYSFSQVAKMTYNYKPESLSLNSNVQQQLTKMLRYSAVDDRVLGIIVDAHSHKLESYDESLQLAQVQADLVVNYLVKNGFNATQILSRVHGDKFPIASNAERNGPAKNRRVTVRLENENLRANREAKIESRRLADELTKINEEKNKLAEATALETKEREMEAYAVTARAAMSTTNTNNNLNNDAKKLAGNEIKKTRVGITLEEFQRLVEEQDLSQPVQPNLTVTPL